MTLTISLKEKNEAVAAIIEALGSEIEEGNYKKALADLEAAAELIKRIAALNS